jgi:hypothetical protein
MESTAEKSCWGVTLRVVLGFALLMAALYLFKAL